MQVVEERQRRGSTERLLLASAPTFLILGLSAIAWIAGFAPAPEGIFSVPRLPRETLWALDFQGLLEGSMITVVVAFLFVDMLDTAGTLLGVGNLGGFLDKDGNFPGSDRAFTADAVGTTSWRFWSSRTTLS